MTSRDNYLIAARGGKPEWLPIFPNDCNVFALGFWKERDPVTGVDFCNIKWIRDEYGEMPVPGWRAMEDISQWRETVKFPVVSEMDWEGMAKQFHESKDPDKVNIARLNTHGLLLIPVNMLGWEDALCAIYEEPEEMEAFVSRLTEFMLEIVEYFGKYIHPDIVFTGDDFAAGGGPLMSLQTFRDMYAPYLTRICEAIHKIGALAEFHCCGNCQFLTREFLACGYDICQLPEPNAQLLADKAEFGSRLVLTGGWDRRGPGCKIYAPEEDVRQSVRTAVELYGKDGGLIFWEGGICGQSEDSKNKRFWVNDEAIKYGKVCYKD